MDDSRTFVVVPFQRFGTHIGAHQAIVFHDVGPARMAARKLSERLPGVAVIERRIDEETGDETDVIIEASGAVPPGLASGSSWTMALH